MQPASAWGDDLMITHKTWVEGPVRVFNFSVAHTPSYFAGQDSLWVHNANGDCFVNPINIYPGGISREEAIRRLEGSGYSIEDYDKYIAKKRKAGAEPKSPEDYREARDYFEKDSPIARG